MPAPIPRNETQRLDELYEFDILDTVPEAAYDAITYLASQICDVPIALISIVDSDRQWFKSTVGIDAAQTPRDQAFCAYALHQPDDLMIVPDASTDSRFQANPLVTGDPSIRFYAGAPLTTHAGHVLGTLCVIDRKPRRLSAAQARALEALSLQVMALLQLRRTVQELDTKQRELAEATRQRDTFMATVSHEIRTPLTSVIGYVDLLRSGLPDEERAEVLEMLARHAADVEYLIEDLLIAARAEAESLKVWRVPVSLGAQVAQVLEGLYLDQDIPIIVDTAGCQAAGDPARVRQIVRNLVTNAIRYGGPNILIQATRSGDRCHLTVRDDGPGVPEEDRDRIFEQFGQSAAAVEVASSVGLGLPISRLLAERMGGNLTYRYVDHHSIFDLELPASTAAAVAGDAIEAANP